MKRDNTANRPFGRLLPQDDMTATLADLYKTDTKPRRSRTRIAWAPETLLSLGMSYLEGSNQRMRRLFEGEFLCIKLGGFLEVLDGFLY